MVVLELQPVPVPSYLNWREASLECRGGTPSDLQHACNFRGLVVDTGRPAELTLAPIARDMVTSITALRLISNFNPSKAYVVGTSVAALAVAPLWSPPGLVIIAGVTLVEASLAEGGGLVFLVPSGLPNRKYRLIWFFIRHTP